MMDFYYGSGSPYAWRVWLALEHKNLQYQRINLSFQDGDLKKDSFLSMNPRGKVPVLVDGEVTIFESSVILEYLEDKYPNVGANLFPLDVKARALSRIVINEIDVYLDSVSRRLLMATLFTPKEKWDESKISRAAELLDLELKRFDEYFVHSYEQKKLSAVEFSMFPIIALILRIEKHKPDLGFSRSMSSALESWFSALKLIPIFQTTRPPHWG